MDDDLKFDSVRQAGSAAALVALLLALGACGPDGRESLVESVPENPLYVDPADYDFGDNPELLERLRATPHRYLRFVNVAFSEEVCRRFSTELAEAPTFNLHGDAHVEQYAVTESGRGMTDFDDSSMGPAMVDIVRFGVSVRVACGQEGCRDQAGAIFGEFLRGYRAALGDPEIEVPEPRLARLKREKFQHDRSGFFQFVESVMEPMPEDEEQGLTEALEPYFSAMKEEHGDRGDEYFAVQGMGYLKIGVGSALDLKFLVRVRGASDDPLDDVVLEVKQVRDLGSISCITVDPGTDPLRVVRGHLRIANQPYRFLGYARFEGRNFWVHAWEENYSELDVQEAFRSPEDVAEVAYDVGVQLGRGHTRQIAPQIENQLRREQLRLLDRDAALIRETCRELADLTVEAWERFKAGR